MPSPPGPWLRRIAPIATVVAALSVTLVSGRQDPPPQQPPTFRAGTDLVRVDVTVLNRGGNPVTSLTAADFEVRDNGQPQEITSFKLVEATGQAPDDDVSLEIRHPGHAAVEAARDDVRVFLIFWRRVPHQPVRQRAARPRGSHAHRPRGVRPDRSRRDHGSAADDPGHPLHTRPAPAGGAGAETGRAPRHLHTAPQRHRGSSPDDDAEHRAHPPPGQRVGHQGGRRPPGHAARGAQVAHRRERRSARALGPDDRPGECCQRQQHRHLRHRSSRPASGAWRVPLPREHRIGHGGRAAHQQRQPEGVQPRGEAGERLLPARVCHGRHPDGRQVPRDQGAGEAARPRSPFAGRLLGAARRRRRAGESGDGCRGASAGDGKRAGEAAAPDRAERGRDSGPARRRSPAARCA